MGPTHTWLCCRQRWQKRTTWPCRFLARSLSASFIQGVAQGFKTSQQTIVTTDSGTVSSNPVDDFGEGLTTGVSAGASSAAEKLSDFYLELAEEIFPIIEIGAARNMTVVFTQGQEVVFDKKLVMGDRNDESL
ncbi:MAG: TrbI/VirB10 family protein [Bacteroidota bacterium]